jgi:hypothetical protein
MIVVLDKLKEKVDKHYTDSIPYRKKIDVIWSSAQLIKWMIGLIFGAGLLWNAVNLMRK